MPVSSGPPPPRENGTPWKLIVFGVLAVYAILIVFFNRKQVKVSFVFFSAEISLLVLILLCVGHRLRRRLPLRPAARQRRRA